MVVTAKELLETKESFDEDYPTVSIGDAIEMAIEFANLHCIEQGKVISEKFKIDWNYLNNTSMTVPDEDSIKANKESILNAYPLDNIK